MGFFSKGDDDRPGKSVSTDNRRVESALTSGNDFCISLLELSKEEQLPLLVVDDVLPRGKWLQK